jgi:HlyD family secretion protein
MFDTTSVSSGTIEVGVSSAGIVEPLATVEVKSKASGEVLDLLVETGDFVEEGTLMVRIDPRTVRNRLDQSEAELKAANSRREIAQSQMERAERLLSQGTYTQADLEQAALDLANAEAQVVTARVSVENARIAVDDTEIRALSEVQIRTLVDETDIGKVRPGMSASVSVAAYPNQPFPGQVIKIEPQAVLEQNVTMFAVLVAIENPDGLLLPGMNAEVDVRIARSENVLTVPIMALRTSRDLKSTASILGVGQEDIRAALGVGQQGEMQMPKGRNPERQALGETGSSDYRYGGKFWVVVDNEGSFEFRNVVTGITDLDRVEVVEGLRQSDSVLILPSTHLVETQQDLQNWINRRIGRVPGIR